MSIPTGRRVRGYSGLAVAAVTMQLISNVFMYLYSSILYDVSQLELLFPFYVESPHLEDEMLGMGVSDVLSCWVRVPISPLK